MPTIGRFIIRGNVGGEAEIEVHHANGNRGEKAAPPDTATGWRRQNARTHASSYVIPRGVAVEAGRTTGRVEWKPMEADRACRVKCPVRYRIRGAGNVSENRSTRPAARVFEEVARAARGTLSPYNGEVRMERLSELTTEKQRYACPSEWLTLAVRAFGSFRVRFRVRAEEVRGTRLTMQGIPQEGAVAAPRQGR